LFGRLFVELILFGIDDRWSGWLLSRGRLRGLDF
jgi:hypothetical protein